MDFVFENQPILPRYYREECGLRKLARGMQLGKLPTQINRNLLVRRWRRSSCASTGAPAPSAPRIARTRRASTRGATSGRPSTAASAAPAPAWSAKLSTSCCLRFVGLLQSCNLAIQATPDARQMATWSRFEMFANFDFMILPSSNYPHCEIRVAIMKAKLSK